MTFEMFGAGCFGTVIGFVAWHAFRAGETAFGVKQLIAFIGALLGAVVLAAFPAGTALFSAYASGLALGFFLVPASRLAASTMSSLGQGLSLLNQAPIAKFRTSQSILKSRGQKSSALWRKHFARAKAGFVSTT